MPASIPDPSTTLSTPAIFRQQKHVSQRRKPKRSLRRQPTAHRNSVYIRTANVDARAFRKKAHGKTQRKSLARHTGEKDRPAPPGRQNGQQTKLPSGHSQGENAWTRGSLDDLSPRSTRQFTSFCRPYVVCLTGQSCPYVSEQVSQTDRIACAASRGAGRLPSCGSVRESA